MRFYKKRLFFSLANKKAFLYFVSRSHGLMIYYYYFYAKKFLFSIILTQSPSKWRKNLYIKINDENPSIKSTRQKRTQVDSTRRKKTKANNQQKWNQIEILCKENSRLQNDNPRQQRRSEMKKVSSLTNWSKMKKVSSLTNWSKMQKVSSLTNWLVREVHYLWCVEEMNSLTFFLRIVTHSSLTSDL